MLNADLYMVFELQAKATSSTSVIDLNYLDWLTVGFQYNTSSFGSSIANTTSLILELGDGIPTANQSSYEFANQQNISSNQLRFDIKLA